ncbi:MAG: tripartite tricarboxylate transporter permease, partial [Clostridia bacterium]|nr:tripartite tricarboxylate transporter permease [Clostridia bacterium]
NNATIGGAMVPLLTLGIPGDTTTAMLLGALTLHGLTPGPLLFQNQADIVYGIFAAMLISSVIMLFMEFFGLRVFVKLLSIPKYILLPCVFVLCVIGAYALKNNMSQVIACIIFGIIGFTFKKLDIPTTPFILGFILGPLAEVNYRRGMIRTKGSFIPFLTSPISAVFLVIAIAVLLIYATKPLRQKKKA